jgi:hypothetical protein
MNYLVAAQANGVTASDAIDRIGQFTVLENLASAAEDKPGLNLQYLNGIVYNMIYMDMELGGADAVFTDYPHQVLPHNESSVRSDDEHIILTKRYDRYETMIEMMNNASHKAYTHEDYDLDALMDYLTAKRESAV